MVFKNEGNDISCCCPSGKGLSDVSHRGVHIQECTMIFAKYRAMHDVSLLAKINFRKYGIRLVCLFVCLLAR